MIHRAVRQLVLDQAGPFAWMAVQASARIGEAEMIIAESYDDALTHRLLAAAGEYLNLKPDQTWAAFGRYWIHYAGNGPLGSIMAFTGDDIVSFVSNLELLHRNVQFVMPAARLPKFILVRNEPGILIVRYHSSRTGLEPFVTGLFEGLLDRFGLTGTIQPLEKNEDAFEFQVTYQAGAAQ